MSEAYAAGPGAIMPAPDGGPPFTNARITAVFAGNDYLDREDGGVVRRVARVESITRVVFEPIPGRPSHRDHNLARVTDAHAFTRRGQRPERGPTPRPPIDQDALDASYDRLADARAAGDTPYPGRDT